MECNICAFKKITCYHKNIDNNCKKKTKVIKIGEKKYKF